MQRLFILLLFAICTEFPLNGSSLNIEVVAESAMLINADSGAVLFEKEAHKLQYPGSTTKIAAVLYALNRGGVSLDRLLTADAEALTPTTELAKKRANYDLPPYWLETDGCHISLKKGEQMSLKDLLMGMLLRSGNDASNVVAQYIGGSIPQFMSQVNNYLRDLGCTSTHFVNPHGLHHPDHMTTAHDLAIQGREALKNPLFCEMMSTIRYTRPKTNLQEATPWIHSNRLIRKGSYYYAKALGIKTGYHARALHNIVAAARDGDRTLILVLLHCPDRKEMFQEVRRVFEAAFHEPKVERTLLKAGSQPVALKLPGARKLIEPYLPEPIVYTYYPAEEAPIQALIYWDNLTLPILKGQRVGEVRLVSENESVLARAPLYATDEVHPSAMHRLATFLRGVNPYLWVALLIACIAAIIFVKTRFSAN